MHMSIYIVIRVRLCMYKVYRCCETVDISWFIGRFGQISASSESLARLLLAEIEPYANGREHFAWNSYFLAHTTRQRANIRELESHGLYHCHLKMTDKRIGCSDIWDSRNLWRLDFESPECYMLASLASLIFSYQHLRQQHQYNASEPKYFK